MVDVPGIMRGFILLPFLEWVYLQMYVSQLANVPKAALSDAGVHIALVGCGSWEPIGNYKSQFAIIFKGSARCVYVILVSSLQLHVC